MPFESIIKQFEKCRKMHKKEKEIYKKALLYLKFAIEDEISNIEESDEND